MRISIREGDSGWNTWQDLSRSVVTLDGNIVKGVITADENLGYVVVYMKDSWGYPAIGDNGTLIEQKQHGRVEITFKDVEI